MDEAHLFPKQSYACIFVTAASCKRSKVLYKFVCS